MDRVAQAILGEGKTVSAHGEAKLRELERLRRDEPARSCEYCLRDAELVLAILARTGLDALTARRAAPSSIAPSSRRPRRCARRVVPPARTDAPISGAAGGAVLEARAGLFDNVLVFDLRSLYPSLMRTFHLDPLAHDRRWRVDDVATRTGPEPVSARTGAPLDHEHDLERQLRPIAESNAQALGTGADEWLGDAGRPGSFASARCGR